METIYKGNMPPQDSSEFVVWACSTLGSQACTEIACIAADDKINTARCHSSFFLFKLWKYIKKRMISNIISTCCPWWNSRWKIIHLKEYIWSIAYIRVNKIARKTEVGEITKDTFLILLVNKNDVSPVIDKRIRSLSAE